MFDLSALRRRLIGGIWIKKREESCYRYCVYSSVSNDWLSHYDTVNGKYWGFGCTNVETLEDHGEITWLGKLRGYKSTSARIYRRNIIGSLLDKLSMETGLVMFAMGLIMLLNTPEINALIIHLCS